MESTMRRKNLFFMGSWVVFLSILTSQVCLAGVMVPFIEPLVIE
jgi:hypothetical protein